MGLEDTLRAATQRTWTTFPTNFTAVKKSKMQPFAAQSNAALRMVCEKTTTRSCRPSSAGSDGRIVVLVF